MFRSLKSSLRRFTQPGSLLSRYQRKKTLKKVIACWLVERYGAQEWIKKTTFRVRDGTGELIVPYPALAGQLRYRLHELHQAIKQECPRSSSASIKRLHVRVKSNYSGTSSGEVVETEVVETSSLGKASTGGAMAISTGVERKK